MDAPDGKLLALLSASTEWAARLYHFNYQPADYLHRSRRMQFTASIATDAVWQTARARPALSAHILAALGTNSAACFDLSYDEWPLVLLDADRLERLARYAAAALHAPAISRCILHSEVSQWLCVLEPDAYKFALHGVQFLPDFGLPESFGDPAQSVAAAYGWIEASILNAPGSLLARGRLKLPSNSRPAPADPVLARRLMFALLSILEPSWRSSFTALRT